MLKNNKNDFSFIRRQFAVRYLYLKLRKIIFYYYNVQVIAEECAVFCYRQPQ